MRARQRSLSLWVGLCVSLCVGLSSKADAQRGRAQEEAVHIAWSVFVAGLPEEPPARRQLGPEAGELTLPGSSWSCRYEEPGRVQLDSSTWSEQRTLLCHLGEARVGTRASCRVHGDEVYETPATLELGAREPGQSVTLTLGCRGQRAP